MLKRLLGRGDKKTNTVSENDAERNPRGCIAEVTTTYG